MSNFQEGNRNFRTMELGPYDIIKNSKHFYEFYSDGPKGIIKKVIYYQAISDYANNVYNLAFGDWDHTNNCLNDKSVSNNEDRDKVLATVAISVIEFTNDFPDAAIYASGSSSSRNRLYQMSISKYWSLINPLFEIRGLIGNRWELFKFNVNYEAFLLKHK